MAQRFVVIGAGAIGCRVGGALAAAGADVTFVARGRRSADLAAHGLAVTDLEGATRLLCPDRFRLAAAAAEAATMDGADPVLLLCTKGGATAEAAAEAGAAFAPGTPVLSLQNGVDNIGRIRAAARDLQALAAMVPFNVTLDRDESGRLVARQTTSGELHAEDHAVTRALAPLFAAAGLRLTLVADMVPVQWGKLLLNLNNPVNALSGLPLRAELMDRDCRRALAALQDEALAVMKAAGIRPAKIGAAPPRLIPTILRLPTFAFSRIAASMLTIAPTARSSMADDLAAGRPTEIDDLCGAVVRLAAAAGLTAPRNAAMVRLVSGRRPGAAMSGRDILAAVTAA
ncbi:MAG: 2-dehydropantoate 2-reductase [Phreatobacter sp.]|uniref:2-dehydropantoate 2-reductase n=1 Tax=Phreatobacter sp. TaxID=1966341 RepID=UPI0040361454